MGRGAGAIVTCSVSMLVATLVGAGCGGGGGGGGWVAAPPTSSQPPPSAAETVQVAAAPPTAVADGADAVIITATVLDAVGAPLQGATVQLAASSGATVSPATASTDGAGMATATLTATSAGDVTVAVVVTSPGTTLPLVTTITLLFTAPPPPPPPPPPPSRWTMFGGGAGHTGFNADEVGEAPATQVWFEPLAASELSPAVVDAGRVAVSARYDLWVLDAATGATLWTRRFYRSGSTTQLVFKVGHPALVGDRVYVQVCDQTPGTDLWVLDAATGATVMVSPFSAQWEDYWAPLVVGDRVYINGGYYGGMYAFDGTNGAQLWFHALEQYDAWSPTLTDDGQLLSFVTGNLRSHDTSTGARLWTVTVPWSWAGYDMNTAAVTSGDRVYVIAPPTLHAVDLTTQQVAWSTSGYQFSGTPSIAQGTIYAVAGGGLLALDAGTGLWKWTFAGDRALAKQPVVANDVVYVASASNAYAVEADTGAQLWTAPDGGWPTLADGQLYVARPDGALVAYRLGP